MNPLTVKVTKGKWEEIQRMEYINKSFWCNNKLNKLTLEQVLGEDNHTCVSAFECNNKGNRIWEAKETNIQGQWKSILLGNAVINYSYHSDHMPSRMWVGDGNKMDINYEFDPDTWNLSSYSNLATNQKESYEYDAMNRLRIWTVSDMNDNNKTSWEQQYNTVNGNISSKTGFGSNLEYGTKSHALAKFTPASLSLYNEEQKIEYTDFKKVKKITQGKKELQITYGTDEQRVKSVMKNGQLTTNRYYIGKYEEEVTGSTTRKLNYIYAGNGLAAVYIQNSSGNNKLYYTYTDYKGSLIALADKNGNIEEEYAYDPWGVRRNPNNWRTADSRRLTLNRGYTLHEHLPEFSLINMNGRMYDPHAGLFFSPDPYVQAPENWLNYNRYTYCLNNPLIYTDPSGEIVFTALAAIFCPALLPLGFSMDQGWMSGGFRGISKGMSFMDGAWRGAVGSAVGGLLAPIGGSSVGLVGNIILGAGQGALTGVVDAALFGDNIGKGALKGAGTGALFGLATSENTQNLVKGKGFNDNNKVFSNFRNGKYAIPEGSTWQQEALNYFGFKGTYDPNNKIFKSPKMQASDAAAHPTTGEIFYKDSPFLDNYYKLAKIANHELFHSNNIISGETSRRSHPAEEEWYAYMKDYKNQGLYPQQNRGTITTINYYGNWAEKYNGYDKPFFTQKWYHLIYKIPRRW